MNTELLQKYIEGSSSETEKVTITKWLDSDPKHMKEFLALRKLHDITIWQTSLADKKIKKSSEKHSNRSWKYIYIEVFKIAAILLVAILISQYFLSEPSVKYPVAMQTINIPAGQRAEITLADGTKVWLNAKTTFTFPNQFSEKTREVKLDGEGFFEVTSNKSKPFIVKTEKYDIKVLGTKFNLMAYRGKGIFETSLLEGSVEVIKSGDSKDGIMIKPDEQIFEKNNRLVIVPIVHMNHFLWKEGIISFNDEIFPELVNKLELYFDLKIKVKNAKIMNYRCTGKFRTKDGVEHILKVLQLSNKFSFKIDDKLNIITIE
ncbi:MAG: FecR family protein [Prolixibacteraceae bacterium]|jgi:ferric-dicitrate binding protein FerR (iron transport regulator)|nr:FecR family protein [Prolixibacteraceae bacterium]